MDYSVGRRGHLSGCERVRVREEPDLGDSDAAREEIGRRHKEPGLYR
jgi:hypothetical protein